MHHNNFLSQNITMIGLRFFSVYGPFGRPDMAYYSFTKSITKSKEIKIYNLGEMYRDMTYIDDIIDGTIGSINLIKTIDERRKHFNLGNEQPN